jgi:hypothetical protein
MRTTRRVLLLCLLAVMASSIDIYFSDNQQSIPTKKGLTFQATIWPEEKNSWVGRMSCNGCDPQLGDTSCSEKLPVLCIVHPRTLDRPYYGYYPDFTPYDNPDQSFYEGWTGGVLAVTDPVRGLEIDSYKTGDSLCKTAFGPKAKFAQFTDGWYMKNMNGPNLKIEKAWNWTQAASGEYNLWGVFNHDHLGRSWVWTQTTPTGNCVLPKSIPIV